MAENKALTLRAVDFSAWYNELIARAELADYSPVRGCMVIRPNGYAIWEQMQRALDQMFKDTGHQNAYFPLFIPQSFLSREAEHVEGFAPETAVVTHGGGKELDEPLVVRPTSETIIYAMYAKWIQSYRDLPVLINQWANVVRWEMRTRLFLRTTEFLWQEGHTAHATAEEARDETMRMLGVYADFAENWMAMPVIQGEKTAGERFPGAVATYAIEAMMQDRKALQSGTSHFLGQNFSKAQEIKFQDAAGQIEYAWTTSWGVSTRLVGALIMTHSDDDGLVLPPRLAPKHVVLLPIFRSEEEKPQVLDYVQSLKKELEAQDYAGGKVRVMIDDRDIRGGEKNWHHVKRGVPLRAEIGPKDIAKNGVFLARRDTGEKAGVGRAEFVGSIGQRLTEIQTNLFQRALKLREENTRAIDTLGDFLGYFTPKSEDKPEIHGGFALCHYSEGPDLDEFLKKHKVTIRCIPLTGAAEPGKCFLTGRSSAKRAVFAKAY